MARWFSNIILLLVFLGIGAGWTYLRGSPLGYLDLLWFSIGVASLMWIMVWVRGKNASKQSLAVPYSPIFLVPILGMVGVQLKLLTSLDFLNLLVFFLCGYILIVPIISILELVTGKSIFLPQKPLRKSR